MDIVTVAMKLANYTLLTVWLMLTAACGSPDSATYTEEVSPEYYKSESTLSRTITLLVMIGIGDRLISAEVDQQNDDEVVVKVVVERSRKDSVDSGHWVKPELDLDDELGNRTVRDISGAEVRIAPPNVE